MRMLHIQYKPSTGGRSISVNYSMTGASPEVIESEVTSKIEGVLSGISGCTGISSSSKNGSGKVTVSFGKKANMSAARFEVASAIRNVYSSLPSGVTYPSISLSVSGGKNSAALSYQVKGALPSLEIKKVVERVISTPLSKIKGVDNVRISGVTPYHWVITYNAEAVRDLGIVPPEIKDAIGRRFGDNVIGMTDNAFSGKRQMVVRLTMDGGQEFGDIPVKKVGDRVVYLRDIATWQYEEELPTSYYRVNGLNTIILSISVASNSNLLTVISDVKREIARLQSELPPEITLSVGYDSSEYVSTELRKIYTRTLLCLLILLVFVFLVNRSWRNMLIVLITLMVNILVAIGIYAFSGIAVHIYTLAGITVSLGIVIDTTIMMSDHYGYYYNRSVIFDLVAAVSTTIAALLLVLLLPESERGNLTDFILVIIINLSISLAVAYFFIPALMTYLPMHRSAYTSSVRRRRRVLWWNRIYSKYIRWGVRHRWVYVVVFVCGFGLPFFLIPKPEEKEQGPFYEKYVRPVLSWSPYFDNRQDIDKWLGSTFGMFYRSLDRASFYREPEKQVLYIRAGMPEGCSVQQLNDIVRSMENYLASFDEISVFTTSISSHDDAVISVEFKPEYEYSTFPVSLKSKVTNMAINFGGANWRVYGIDESSFNNNIVTGFKSNNINLYGYNFEELYKYAELLLSRLSGNRRVSEPEITTSEWYDRPATEFVLNYDFEHLAAAGINPYSYYSSLLSVLYDESVGDVLMDGELTDVELKASTIDEYDLWHVMHEPIGVDSTQVTLSDVGSIRKSQSNIDINKKNQSYKLTVAFDFIGSTELAKKLLQEQTDYMNDFVLPIGFRAENPGYGWFDEHKDQYAWLILLIIAVVYVMLAMAFESLKYPLPLIFMIPISFIGLFLVFGLSRFTFDQGGFAAFVMLCGVVVNAGIYLIRTWKEFDARQKFRPDGGLRAYIKAYNHKINPIMLTVISTILGLLPFLSDGPKEAFWFDFAAGTIGGMLFSIIALLVFFPVFLLKRKEVR